MINLEEIWDDFDKIGIQQKKEELLEFIKVIENMQNRRGFLEVGTHNTGIIPIIFKYFQKSLGLDILRFDNWKQHTIQGIAEYRQVTRRRQLNVPIVKNFFTTLPIDLIFIDAEHTENHVQYDYNSYFPLLSSGGIVAFHDICPNTPKQIKNKIFGVHKVFNRLKKNYKYQEIFYPYTSLDPTEDWGGIGLIWKS